MRKELGDWLPGDELRSYQEELGECETTFTQITRPLTRSLAALGIDLSPKKRGERWALDSVSV
ncbi:hypothetical protein SAMN05519104_4677 [Rhizobiales bacterium GAS188]|nr:hypothetical protein SAMN05519104_4677 [Rhizobiales bacterium GAS188]